ncbi:MAG TPA: HAD family hydrolase [Flavitalea sp.]|nr:HAD family hydrolase [Flavitalea sp.]
MNGRIAFFDFDGTITYKDTLLEFIRFAKGDIGFYSGFLLYSPALVAFKLKLISNQAAKQLILRHFFGKMPLAEFNKLCNDFAVKVVPGLVRYKALHELQELEKNNFRIVVVSASAENWVKLWAEKMGYEYIATRLETVGDSITGRIAGSNCFGEEKVNRIKQQYNLSDYSEVYCYGDSAGDRPMLALGTKSFFKPFT